MNEVLTKLKEDIDTLYATRESKIASLENQIETANADAEKADKDMITASDAEDIKGYSKAKAAKATALDKASMCGTKLRRLKSRELVTTEEQKAFADAVRVEQDAALAELTVSVKEALTIITDAYNKAMPVIDYGDELITEYHNRIKPFEKVYAHRGSESLTKPDLPVSGKNAAYTTMHGFLERVLRNGEYKLYMGHESSYKADSTPACFN